MLVDLGTRGRDDYLAIVDYISDYSVASANEFIRAFEAALEDLRNFPKLGMAEDNSELTRILRFGEYYRLEYALEPDRVFILRVKDGRRQAD